MPATSGPGGGVPPPRPPPPWYAPAWQDGLGTVDHGVDPLPADSHKHTKMFYFSLVEEIFKFRLSEGELFLVV